MRQLFSVKYGSFLRKVTMKELVISLKIEKEKPLNLQDFSAAILALNASLSRFVEQEMLENPYNYRFLVDLEVYKDERGKITTYRAYHYKDKILKG